MVQRMSTPEDTTPTETPSTIGSINAPADVGDGATTTTEAHCYDVSYNGNSPFPPGIGQDDNFMPCALPVAEVGTPPELPSTGYAYGLPGVGLGALLLGAVLLRVVRRPAKTMLS